ncbi:hypothetical protein TNCV_914191 [Trichonephila clavipes]|nr:hypothetical protein TNCV_914191 [Trichonephila clavipes]
MVGRPLLEINLLKDCKNAVVERDVISSNCTAMEYSTTKQISLTLNLPPLHRGLVCFDLGREPGFRITRRAPPTILSKQAVERYNPEKECPREILFRRHVFPATNIGKVSDFFHPVQKQTRPNL